VRAARVTNWQILSALVKTSFLSLHTLHPGRGGTIDARRDHRDGRGFAAEREFLALITMKMVAWTRRTVS
jgi:hypothetical protein